MLFVALAVSADDYFCPSIEIISRVLRLSQNIAGVTIMALGNGAPDIFRYRCRCYGRLREAAPSLILVDCPLNTKTPKRQWCGS